MSVAMDRALMALSLEEEDEPFEMPDLPGFCSNERNILSLVGRTLNPECQKMSTLIWRMPRKWVKEGKCRGVALSEERFQFFFDHEHDLLDVLEKGVHTFNEWALVIERWVEEPPDDYLQYIPLWVRMSKIPTNYYTKEALMALGDLVGEVKELIFDPLKPQSQPFIRVQVRFNVANPLKRMREIKLKGGKTATIHFDYERIQKRCFTCQRLNHEQKICPLVVQRRRDDALIRRQNISQELDRKKPTLQEDDPLFGVLSEEQVGINQVTGRPKIVKEVLDEMRQYLLMASDEDRLIREERVKSSVAAVEQDPVLQRTVLRLEPSPKVSQDLNKGKGIVFAYEESNKIREGQTIPEKLMASAIRAGTAGQWNADNVLMAESEDANFGGNFVNSSLGSTVFSTGFSEPCASSGTKKKTYQRKRPQKSKRKPRPLLNVDKVEGVLWDKAAGKTVWERLSRIGVNRKEKWCMIGDFNEILNNNEKLGGPARSEESFKPFGDMLKLCGMEELESVGDRFTWSGSRWKKFIRCCLDRAFGNTDWRSFFPGSNQKFLEKRGSDHRPILMKLQASQVAYRGQFRFDKKFLFHPGIKKRIIEAWNGSLNGRDNRSVAKRLRDCRGKLLYKAYREEEWFWRQKSRDRWLKHGDRNSKFFHDSVKANRSRRRLDKLLDENGVEQWSEAAKAQVAVDYFSQLFRSSNPPNFTLLFQDMMPRVTEAMNHKLASEELLLKGLKKRVGDGNSILVWIDKWIEDEADGYGLRAPWIKNCTFDVNLKARAIIDFQARRWSTEKLEELFVPSDVKILMKYQPVINREDFWSWKFNKSGAYSVKSGYWLATKEKNVEMRRRAEELPSVNCLKTKIWKVHSTPKIRLFLWKALSDALPVVDLIRSRGINCDERCQICGFEGESINHVLFLCDIARQCWAHSNIPHPNQGFNVTSIFQNFHYLLLMSKNVQVDLNVSRVWPWILWYLWKNRNAFLFEGKLWEPLDIVCKAREEADSWFLAQQVERVMDQEESRDPREDCCECIQLPVDWTQCEIGLEWDKVSGLTGASWIARDSCGRVTQHSRWSLVDIASEMEAKMQVLLWALESMISLKKQKVLFLAAFQDLFEAVMRPRLRPALQFEAEEIKAKLRAFVDWDVKTVPVTSLRCVYFIAQSVLSLGFTQSYVAAGHPRWLDPFFVNEIAASTG
ncbi:hypothetical protein Bca52824_004400 [Brassica carinata]|uniref:Reverse transcriptase zinc-binding domain-containing protein n=1 Tax=Brassica carinata TaxID=52824 RepID=A0A8X8BFN5_BRACI|nr:hypothetical protein Bca52824_004400 [Brassica carinata]